MGGPHLKQLVNRRTFTCTHLLNEKNVAVVAVGVVADSVTATANVPTAAANVLLAVCFVRNRHVPLVAATVVAVLAAVPAGCKRPNKSLDASGGGVFRNLIRSAMLE
jgi:hypothetical protein